MSSKSASFQPLVPRLMPRSSVAVPTRGSRSRDSLPPQEEGLRRAQTKKIAKEKGLDFDVGKLLGESYLL